MSNVGKDSLMRSLIGLLLGAVVLSQVAMFSDRDHAVASAEDPFYFDLRLPPERMAVDKQVVGHLLVDAIIQIESGGNPKTVGSKGERGLMQIMPMTWRDVTRQEFDGPLPFDEAFNPEMNRLVGRAYLKQLKQHLYQHNSQWNADLRSLLLASYNAGPKAVQRAHYNIAKLPRSTQSYVRRGAALHDALLDQEMQKAEARAPAVLTRL